MERLDRTIQWWWMAAGAIGGLVLGVGIGVLGYLALEIEWLALPAAVVLSLLWVVYSYYRYKNWMFVVHEEYLEIEHGVIWKVSVVVPYVRVQHIDTNRGPVERLLGLATLRVYTAGSEGADLGIPGLDRERADRMQAELREKAIESDQGADGV